MRMDKDQHDHHSVVNVYLQGAQADVPLAGQAGLLRKAEADAHRKVAIQVWWQSNKEQKASTMCNTKLDSHKSVHLQLTAQQSAMSS